MLPNDEYAKRQLRHGEFQHVLACALPITEIISDDLRLLQSSSVVPLDDALRALAVGASRLLRMPNLDKSTHVAGVDKESLQKVILSLVAIEPQQAEIFGESNTVKALRAETERLQKSHQHASDIAKALQENARMPMESFTERLDQSPDAEMTSEFLLTAGPDSPRYSTPNGELPQMKAVIPHTLPAKRPVELEVRVISVSDRDSTARVQILTLLNDQSKEVLRHRTYAVTMKFNAQDVQREDLLAAQYLRHPLSILAGAECATHREHARKTVLTLLKVCADRETLDRWHATARQAGLRFDGLATSADA